MDKKVLLRPSDIASFRTSEPKKMLNMYLPHNVVKKYTEDFLDEDTGELVSIERSEILFRAGTKLTKDIISKIMFSIQSEEIKDVEVCSRSVPLAERYITQYMHYFFVVISANTKISKVLVGAQTMEQAVQISIDFLNVYRNIYGYVSPIKAYCVGYDVINDDDDCIPEDERIDPVAPKEYFKVDIRLTYIDDSERKCENYEYIVNADEVESARSRVISYASLKFEKTLAENPANNIKVRKAVPFQIDALVPEEYSKLYRIKATV